MKIKHSKFRNTGLIYELLVKQVASDTLENRNSNAIKILKNFYSGNSFLAKEFKLYEFILKNKGIGSKKAETIISTITEVSRRFDQKALKNQKYKLIAEIKKYYDLEKFFSIKVRDYKPLAALYCLLEAQNNSELTDPEVFVNNKITILEHLTQKRQDKSKVKQSLIEEYGSYERDLKLLTYKLLLEKFNEKYDNLLPEQKHILKQFIVSVNSTAKLKEFVNEELINIKNQLSHLSKNTNDSIIKIKVEEITKNISTLSKKDKLEDTNISLLLQYYELINELKQTIV